MVKRTKKLMAIICAIAVILVLFPANLQLHAATLIEGNKASLEIVQEQEAKKNIPVTYAITPLTENAPMPVEKELRISGTNRVTFEPIEIADVGEYEYEISIKDYDKSLLQLDSGHDSYKIHLSFQMGRDRKLIGSISSDGYKEDDVYFSFSYIGPDKKIEKVIPLDQLKRIPPNKNNNKKTSVYTGDQSNLYLWGGIVIVAVGAFIIIMVIRKKRS